MRLIKEQYLKECDEIWAQKRLMRTREAAYGPDFDNGLWGTKWKSSQKVTHTHINCTFSTISLSAKPFCCDIYQLRDEVDGLIFPGFPIA